MARSSFNSRAQRLLSRLFSAALAVLSLLCLSPSPAAARPAGIGITSTQAIALYQEIGVPLGPMKTSNTLKNHYWFGERNGAVSHIEGEPEALTLMTLTVIVELPISSFSQSAPRYERFVRAVRPDLGEEGARAFLLKLQTEGVAESVKDGVRLRSVMDKNTGLLFTSLTPQ